MDNSCSIRPENPLHPNQQENASYRRTPCHIFHSSVLPSLQQRASFAHNPRSFPPNPMAFFRQIFVPFNGILNHSNTFLTPRLKTRPCNPLIPSSHSI